MKVQRIIYERKGIFFMKLSEVKELLGADVYAGAHRMDMEIKQACGSDLMSDVLAFVKEQALLLTGLQNLQVLRTAEMMDIIKTNPLGILPLVSVGRRCIRANYV